MSFKIRIIYSSFVIILTSIKAFFFKFLVNIDTELVNAVCDVLYDAVKAYG